MKITRYQHIVFIEIGRQMISIGFYKSWFFGMTEPGFLDLGPVTIGWVPNED